MRAVLQRVAHASVAIDGRVVGEIGRGLLAYVGVAAGDEAAQSQWLARRIAELRLFATDDRPLERSVSEIGGGVLVVSQFTLLASTRRGRRPSFFEAAPPEQAEPLIAAVMEALRGRGIAVAGGAFGAHMQVDSTNDGPVTIILDSDEAARPRRG